MMCNFLMFGAEYEPVWSQVGLEIMLIRIEVHCLSGDYRVHL